MTHRYAREGIVINSATPLTNAGLAQAIKIEKARQAVRKAKTDPPIPAYDANGKLVGLVDPHDLIPIEDSAADAARAAATTDPRTAEVAPAVAAAGDEVQKALVGAIVTKAAGEESFVRKSATDRRTVDVRYAQLLKSIDAPHVAAVQSAVTMGALRIGVLGIASQQAIQLAKSAALDAAASMGRRPSQASAANLGNVFAELRKRIG